MPKPDLDKVEIVEPPIGELTKKRHGFLRSCLTGCGCIVIFIIVCAVGIKLALGPGPKNLSSLPENFPKEIPIYDKDNIQKMVYIPGKYKSRGSRIASFLPRIIFSSLITESAQKNKNSGGLKQFWQLFKQDGDARNSIQIEWTNIDAEPSFVFSYYKKELQKKDYEVEVLRNTHQNKEMQFFKKDISGTLYATGDELNKAGTDEMVMTVNLP